MKYKVFFSVYNGSNLDAANHLKVFNKLYRFNPKQVNGSYKGIKESSILVYISDKELSSIEKIAREFKQESILIVDSKRNSFLKYLSTNKVESIGRMLKTSKLEALTKDSYSEVNGIYYIVE